LNSQQILEQADTCVKCGLCLAHCPTYRECVREGDSPRGRVALIQGLLAGELPDRPALRAPLRRCLQCGACESACPSGVPVTALVAAVQARHNAALPAGRRRLRLALLGLAARPAPLAALVRGYQRTGLGRLLRAAGLRRWWPWLGRLEGLLPDLPGPASPAAGGGRDLVLFPGCVARHLEARAQAAALQVLAALGFRVRLPAGDGCCGALYHHEGFPAQARRERERLAALLAVPPEVPVLSMASACQAELARDPALAPRTRELTRFLADLDWPPQLRLRPAPVRVLIHTPCTQRHGLADPGAAAALLRHIPGLQLEELPDNAFCCGAAGSYMLREPALADRLLAPKLAALGPAGPVWLVTTNTGCALHLAAGVRAAGLPVWVGHPVELIARQLPGLAGAGPAGL
jgi:glycolate oxidase iron-sulfur subunit